MRLKQFSVIAFSIGLVSLPLWSLRDGHSEQWARDVRELKTQRLHSARALDILKDHSVVIESVGNRPASVESLTLSLIENIKLSAINLEAKITQLSVVESEEVGKNTLIVEFNAVVNRAIDLLALFDAIREVADWRPMQVRRCTLVRETEAARLRAVCTIQVYYFLGIDS